MIETQTDENLRKLAQKVGEDWKRNVYYTRSESDIGVFWSETSIFKRLFSRLTLGKVVDLACGHGKQSQFLVGKCERLYLVDINPENIAACKARYAAEKNIEYFVTNGFALPQLQDQSIDAIFCYDAMVHFPPEVVRAYLAETRRVLTIGGMGLFHHSNLANPPSEIYSKNPHGRNRMSQELFKEYAETAGLSVQESRTFRWGNDPDLDCLTLVAR